MSNNDENFRDVEIDAKSCLIRAKALIKKERENWRYRFAGQAISLFSLDEKDLDSILNGAKPNHTFVAKFCVELADALLSELEKGDAE